METYRLTAGAANKFLRGHRLGSVPMDPGIVCEDLHSCPPPLGFGKDDPGYVVVMRGPGYLWNKDQFADTVETWLWLSVTGETGAPYGLKPAAKHPLATNSGP
jgi:hypothetical protein